MFVGSALESMESDILEASLRTGQISVLRCSGYWSRGRKRELLTGGPEQPRLPGLGTAASESSTLPLGDGRRLAPCCRAPLALGKCSQAQGGWVERLAQSRAGAAGVGWQESNCPFPGPRCAQLPWCQRLWGRDHPGAASPAPTQIIVPATT